MSPHAWRERSIILFLHVKYKKIMDAAPTLPAQGDWLVRYSDAVCLPAPWVEDVQADSP